MQEQPQNPVKRVSVSGFTDDLGNPIVLNVIHDTIAHECEYSGDTYVMII